MLELIALCFFVVVNGFMGFSVVVRNYRDRANLIFATFIISGMGWAALNFMSNNGSYTSKLVGNMGAFTAGLASMICLWFFSLFFPKKRKAASWQKAAIYLSPLFILISLTPLLVKSFADQPDKDVTSIEAGVAYIPFVLYLALVFIMAAMNFRKASKLSAGTIKQRVELVYFGIGASFIWGLVLSAILPYFEATAGATKYGPLGLLFLTGAIFYAVTKHKLFDVRSAVVRSMVFIITQIMLMTVYIAIVVIIGTAIFSSTFTPGDIIFIAFMAAFISITLPFIVRYFRKLTDKLFFRDSYDTQAVINTLTRDLVGTIGLEDLSKRALTTLNKAVRSRASILVTMHQNNQVPTQVSIGEKISASSELLKALAANRKEVYMADDESEVRKVAELMLEEDLAVIVRLRSHDKMLGYLCFTEKLSGRLYSLQDIRLLVIASNEIALALQNAQRYAEIEQFNLTLSDKVENATHELRKTNEKLKALDEAKDEFISMASHQLRTPLTSVKGYVSMVLEGDAGPVPKTQKELLQQAFISSQRMVYLIADLLNVSRLKTGKFIIEPKPTNLPDMVEGEMQQLVESAKAHNLELTFDKPEKFPTLNIDETKTRQVVMNFMDNALYYTPSGGHIRVELEDKGKTVEYRVVDDGLGVPKADQPHLFTKFYRAGNAKKARPDGTGLGLYMAQKVIVAQGGSIIFSSTEGKGSTFGFSLPAHTPHTSDQAPAKP